MFTLFFTIIFFAELIVAGWIISKIKCADEKVCSFSDKVTQDRQALKQNLQKVNETVSLIHSKLECFTASVAQKKQSCENLFKNRALAEFGLWLFNLPYKKIIMVIDFILTVRKLIKA